MLRTRKPSRRVGRRLIRRSWRTLDRPHVRCLGGFERGPDYLTQALAAYRRAIRAYRRLARLAPSYFDTAVVAREAREREERRQWLASWQPALEKAYGPLTPVQREAQRQADLMAEQRPPLHPRTVRAVDGKLADYQLWKAAGDLSLVRFREYQQRRPHTLPSFVNLARLLELAFDFYAIATGWDWRHPESDPWAPRLPPSDWEADLRRAYGPRDSAAPQMGAPGSRPTFSVAPDLKPEPQNLEPEAHRPEPEIGNLQPSTGNPPSPAPPPSAPPAAYRRRDAWSAWARQQCRRSG